MRRERDKVIFIENELYEIGDFLEEIVRESGEFGPFNVQTGESRNWCGYAKSE